MQKGNTNNGVTGQVVTYCCAVGLKLPHFTKSAQVMASCDQHNDDDDHHHQYHDDDGGEMFKAVLKLR